MIYNRPANVFVGSFIGNPPLNLMSCSIFEENEKIFLKSNDFLIDVTSFKAELIKGAKSKNLILGFRPEDATIRRPKSPSDSIVAKVYVTELLGAQSLITLITSGKELIKIVESSDFKDKLKLGEEVGISLDKKKIHIFDKKTGKIIR